MNHELFFSFLTGIKQKRIYPNFYVCRAQTCNGIKMNEYITSHIGKKLCSGFSLNLTTPGKCIRYYQ